MTFTHDVIIIGRGLAGTVLSEVLAQRGLHVLVYDAPLAGRASSVATGVVNPIVMRRTVLSWRASEMLAIAGAFYRDLEQRYDQRFWHPMPLVELFPTAKEAGIWQLRMKDPELSRLLGAGPVNDPAIEELPQPYGYGVVQRCAWLDVKRLLAAHRERWLSSGNLEEREVRAGDVVPVANGAQVFGTSAPLVVRCMGPFAEGAGLVPVRGEGLTVRIQGFRMKSLVHRGVFILPVPGSGNGMAGDRYRVGSTFAWNDVWSGPTEEARRWILDQLGRVVSAPVEVEDHWAGVRPAARDRRPILGRTTQHQAVLNGLGSRGVLLAPWSAQHLTAHLFGGAPLDPEVDAARFM